jgi:hypothetical protein
MSNACAGRATAIGSLPLTIAFLQEPHQYRSPRRRTGNQGIAPFGALSLASTVFDAYHEEKCEGPRRRVIDPASKEGALAIALPSASPASTRKKTESEAPEASRLRGACRIPALRRPDEPARCRWPCLSRLVRDSAVPVAAGDWEMGQGSVRVRGDPGSAQADRAAGARDQARSGATDQARSCSGMGRPRFSFRGCSTAIPVIRVHETALSAPR